MRRLLGLLVLVLATSPSPADSPAEAWPQFRGFGGSGISQDNRIPIEWGPGRNIAWSAEIPGTGWSSPVVWGDRIFVVSAVPDKEEEKPPRGMRAESQRYAVPDVTYDWKVFCLSLKDGSMKWEKSVKVGKAQKGKHSKNSYATQTPTTDGKRLYVYFSQVGLFAFDFDGKLLWKQHPGAFDTYLEYGDGSSPITDGRRVYLQCDNQEKSFVAAYNCETGREEWRSPRDERTSWSTPFLWNHPLRQELVTVGPIKARSYDPQTGKLLWSLGGMSKQTVPTPIADDQYCYISSGMLVDPRDRPIFAVRPGAVGDITLPDKSNSSKEIAWRNRLGGPYVPSPIVYRGRMYIVHDRPLFDCLDLQTGKSVYPRSRLPKGGNFTASPLAYGGVIFCLTEEGLGYIIDASDEFKVRFVNPALDEEGLFLATPAVAGGSLLIRGAKRLHCVRRTSAR